MSNSKPFFGKMTDKVSEAFPDVVLLKMTITQDPYGYYTNRQGQNIVHATLDNLTRHVRCLNPRCQEGGLDLQNIIRYSDSGEKTIYCRGHEGTAKGRKVGDPCDNSFKVDLVIERTKDHPV